MSHLAIALFAGFQVELDGEPLTAFRTDKNRALLAYLALESGRMHRRESLAALLWPNSSETEARNSLRQALYQLTHLLSEGTNTESPLLITREEVGFNPACDHWIDVHEFGSRLSSCQSHHPQGLSLCAECLESLQQATRLYKGELLEGFTLSACTRFTDWQIFTQESYHHQALAALYLLANFYEKTMDYERLIACTQRKIELEPWRESAYRRQIWALAMSGQRQHALHQYETVRTILQRELGIPPVSETQRLYEQIRNGDLLGSPPSRIKSDQPGILANQPYRTSPTAIFVGRGPELAQLGHYLKASLTGQGQVAFISGEAGSGKTALLHEFACQAMNDHGDLLVVGGACSAYGGLGDPFQPFREVLQRLVGIRDGARRGATISTEPAWRINSALPVTLSIMLASSPGLIGTLLPAQELLDRAQKAARLDSVTLARLKALASGSGVGEPAASRLESQMVSGDDESPRMTQSGPFDQVARLLLALARRFPLLILLDDLQWCHNASASLLFHLAGCLSGARILLLGAYRPEGIASPRDGDRHPLAPLLNECQRRYGQKPVDLSQADGRAFVDAYLDGESTFTDQAFRERLFRHTRGNALFTVELLREMRASGEVIQDESGHWVPGPNVDWERVPPRAEAVIAERLGSLDQECLTLLEAASVQGEVFNAGVLAEVLGLSEGKITSRLSGALCKQHRIVISLGLMNGDGSSQASYRFGSLLFQKYLYQGLDEVERARLRQSSEITVGR